MSNPDRQLAATPDACVASAERDETTLLSGQLEEKLPYFVYRMLAGADAMPDLTGERVSIRSSGRTYIVPGDYFRTVERIARDIQAVDLRPAGFSPPFDPEATCMIFDRARSRATQELKVDPSKLRVLFLRMDSGGCGFYRAIQPTKFLAQTKSIHAEQSDWARLELMLRYDVIVAARVSNPSLISILLEAQRAGKVVIFETDDLLNQIPDWNPNAAWHTAERERMRNLFLRRCDGAIVSTPELAQSIDHPNVRVCLNGIDPDRWPMVPAEQKTDCVRILWAGSATHEKDLEMIVPAIKRIGEKYAGRVKFVFVGYAPPSLSCGYSSGSNVRIDIAPKYRQIAEFVPGCPVLEWPVKLAEQECHIAIAPLIDHPFNRAKSELKVLEAWALGIPIVASNIEPYRRAIKHDYDGYLVGPDAEQWFRQMRRLIENPEERYARAIQGAVSLKQNYIMPKIVEQYERALLGFARKAGPARIQRDECRSAIAARLAELGEA